MALRAVAVSVGRRQPNSIPSSSFLVKASRRISPCFSVAFSNHSSSSQSTGHKFSIIRSIQGATTASSSLNNNNNNNTNNNNNENWKVKMLYDGDCPLCLKEVNMLKRRDKDYDAIKFVDISSDDYSPNDNQGLDYQTAMGRIHAILSDGTVVKDVEAFRKLYEAVGLGWVYSITKYEPVATIADYVYGVWAKYRLPITGRPPLEEILEARKKKGDTCNDSKACKM